MAGYQRPVGGTQAVGRQRVRQRLRGAARLIVMGFPGSTELALALARESGQATSPLAVVGPILPGHHFTLSHHRRHTGQATTSSR